MDWNTKYRPKTFDDIVGQQDIVKYYKTLLPTGKIGNSIFRGRCGIGKTTMARVIKQEFNVDIIPVNGSQDRSLSFFRQRIIPVMKVAPMCGKFRLIFIDEIESMLKEAWMVLKQPIEDYQYINPVIFACNDSSGIPEAIYSRCKTFDFAPITKEDMSKRLTYIAEQEQIEITDDVLYTIIDKSKGDLRKAVDMFEDYSKQAIQIGKNEFEDLFVLSG
jgi:replication factor C small subunit